MSTKQKFAKNELKMPEESFGRAKAPTANEHSYTGIIIGLLILILVLILAGIYLWSQTLQPQTTMQAVVSTSSRPTAAQNKEPESNNARADAETLQVTSSSDEIPAIEADLQSTNLDTINSDIPAIEAELKN